MAEEIVIRTVLALDESGKRNLQRDVAGALNSPEVSAKARDAGRKIGDSLSLGIETGRNRSSAEAKELAHQRRLEAIHLQSAARIQQIEARKQAQLDAIRERALQKELEHQRKIERAAQSGAGSFQTFLRRHSSTIREAGESIQQAGFAALGLTGILVGLGRSAVQSAIDIDRQVNVLKALTGGAEQAEKRFAQLVATAQRTPGLTAGLASTLDAQLRTLSVSEQTIDRVLPAIGRLNAVSPLGDPTRFSQNLVQLITQNFDKQDLRELVGQSPLAGELIKQIFNVDSPTNAKAIRESARKLGINTVEEFFSEFARAAANNPKLQAVTESLGTQFEKLRDRIIVALRPLGLTLIETLRPLVEQAVPAIERLSKAFADLPESVRQAIVIVGGFAAAMGPVIIAVGAMIQAFGALGNIITVVGGALGIGSLSAALPVLIPVIAALAVEVGVLGTAFATNFGGIRDVVADVFGFMGDQFGFLKQGLRDNQAEIDKFIKLFGQLSEEAKPLLKTLGELFKDSFENAIKGAVVVAEFALKAFNIALENTVTTMRIFKSVAREVANAAASVANFLTPGIGLGDILRNRVNALSQGRASSLIPPRTEDEQNPLSALVADLNKLFEIDPRLSRNRGGGGGGGAGARARRFVNDFGLSDATLLEREAELARIRRSNEAVVRRRELAEQAAQRPGQLAGFSAALAERIRQQEIETLRLEQNTRLRNAEELQRTSRRGFNRSGAFIEEAISRGQLTGGEAELLRQGAARDFANQLREVLAAKEGILKANDPLLDDLRDEIGLYDRLGTSISNSECFLRGFNSATESVGDAFERFGENVSRAFTNVRDLFNGLKQAVLSFFNDLLGRSLQNLMRQVLAPVLGGLSNVFGGPSFAGAAGNVFRTPSTFPASIAQAFAGAAGDGISVPTSITSSAGTFGGVLPRPNPAFQDALIRGGIGSFGGGGGAVQTSFLGGIGRSIAAAGPFLGLSIGSSVGGQRLAGQITGAAGGFLTGGLLAAKLTTGIFSKAATAFFTNPITAIAGVGLLVGSVLLGRAAQRRKDEEASGQFLTQALQGIEELAAGVASGQIPGSQARQIFENQILGTFRQQISGLKTKSVVESRLTNQVADLRRVFEARIPPLIAEQERKAADAARFAAIDSRLVPQFAGGGTVPGIDRGRDSVLAMLRPGEKVLTLAQQSSVIAQSNPGVFDRAGVPRTAMRVGGAQAFQFGGTAQPSSFGPSSISLYVHVGMTRKEVQEMIAYALDDRTGQNIIVDAVQDARERGRIA